MRSLTLVPDTVKKKVDGEFAFFGIGYNLSRAENMFTFDELMERVGRKVA